MDSVARVRQASVTVAKVQRRIWLVQTVVLPGVAVVGVITAVAAATWAWRRRNTVSAVEPASRNDNPAASIRD